MRFRLFCLILWVAFCAHVPVLWAEQSHPKDKKSQHNQIDEIIFSPSKILSSADLLTLSLPYTGQRLSPADISQLIDSINKFYLSRGYLTARAQLSTPRPSPHSIRILLIEKDISGDVGVLPPAARRILTGQVLDQPFHLGALQRSMILINEINGLDAKSRLTPLPSGDYNVEFAAKRDWYNGFYQFDNMTNNPRKTVRVLSEVNLNTALPYLETIGVRGAQISGDDTADYAEIFTETWFGINGLRLKNRLAKADSETPSNDLGFVAAGNTDLFETSLLYPVRRDFAGQSSLSFGVKHVDSQSLISGLDYINDEVTSLHLGYSGQASLSDGFESYAASIIQGIDLFGKNDNSTPSRLDANGKFTYLTGEYQRLYRPQNSNMRYTIAAKAQISADKLLAGDEFSLGGADFGRGYGFATATGDDGVAINLEAATPTLRNLGGQFSGHAYAFFDLGATHEKESNVQNDQFEIISSAGIGIRTKILKYDFDAEWAQPVYDDNLDFEDEKNTSRLTFKLTGRF